MKITKKAAHDIMSAADFILNTSEIPDPKKIEYLYDLIFSVFADHDAIAYEMYKAHAYERYQP